MLKEILIWIRYTDNAQTYKPKPTVSKVFAEKLHKILILLATTDTIFHNILHLSCFT